MFRGDPKKNLNVGYNSRRGAICNAIARRGTICNLGRMVYVQEITPETTSVVQSEVRVNNGSVVRRRIGNVTKMHFLGRR